MQPGPSNDSIDSLNALTAGGSVVWHEEKISALVFTDLDGTLLDDSYDIAAAARAMDALFDRGVLVVPASSKTLREMRELDAQRSRPQPFIFENGAGIGWPGDRVADTVTHFAGEHGIELAGLRYEAICAVLDDLKKSRGFGFIGFNEMDAREVAGHTGLTVEAAALARDRMCSEPLLWCDSEQAFERFSESLSQHGLIAVQGGRFVHVMPDIDKGRAALRVAEAYAASGTRLPIIACGDSANDAPLLSIADACVTFPNHSGEHLPVSDRPRLKANAAGVASWTDEVNLLLEQVSEAANDPATDNTTDIETDPNE